MQENENDQKQKREGQIKLCTSIRYIKCVICKTHNHVIYKREREKDTHAHTEIQITKHKR